MQPSMDKRRESSDIPQGKQNRTNEIIAHIVNVQSFYVHIF